VKKILGLTIAIVLITGLVAVGTFAYFSDTEVSAGNSFTAGTIDLAEIGETIRIPDIKPCLTTEWGYITLHNAGANDGNVWLHFTNVLNFENLIVDPEAEAYVANSDYNPDFLRYDNFLECYTTIDVAVDPIINGTRNPGASTVIIDETDGWTLANLACQWIPLGALANGAELEVWVSFHVQDAAGNEFQSDTVQFDLEVLLQQTNDPTAPKPTWPSQMRVVRLENKDNQIADPGTAANMVGNEYWTPMYTDGTYAILSYDCKGPTFDYTLEAYGLTPSTSYTLIYYADPWPGNNPGAQLGTFTADAAGRISFTYSLDINMDLPHPSDANSPDGAKIWLVTSSDWGGTQMTDWNGADYLFEIHPITYNDTDV